MKKLSILLVLVLILGMLAGCKKEEDGTPDLLIPGYNIGLFVGKGWTQIEQKEEVDLEEGEVPVISLYDLEMEKNGMKLLAMGFAPTDFVDLPIAEDLFMDCTDTLLSNYTETSEVSATTSYEKDGKVILSAMYGGKDGNDEKRIYCFMVDFAEDTYYQAWVAFIAKESDMNKNKDAFKTIVETMVCNAEPYDFESAIGDDEYFDEEGNLIVDETETEIFDDLETTPVAEETAPTTGESLEQTTPATTAPVAETVGATEATGAVETTTATTQG